MQLNKFIYKLVDMSANKNSVCLSRLPSFYTYSAITAFDFVTSVWTAQSKQFLPDPDRSSLGHTTAFPASVWANSNHAGVCVRIFVDPLFLKYCRKKICFLWFWWAELGAGRTILKQADEWRETRLGANRGKERGWLPSRLLVWRSASKGFT